MFVNSFNSGYPIPLIKQNGISFMIASDIVSLHKYGSTKNINYKGRYPYIKDFLDYFPNIWNQVKPVLMEEMGPGSEEIYCCTGIEFHNSIWSSVFMGSMGTGLNWSWDRGIHDMGYIEDYLFLDAFFLGENLRAGKYQQQRWKGGGSQSMKYSKIESYSLKSENKERVLGWAHNATYYWRNMYAIIPCVQELVDNNGLLSAPCPLEDGSSSLGTIVHDPTKVDFSNTDFEDGYTNNGGAQVFVNARMFKIKGLKYNLAQAINPWAKKHWYKIYFYRTQGQFLINPLESWDVLSTNFYGELRPEAPFFSTANPDFSYKIEYLGFYRHEPAGLILPTGGNNFRNATIVQKEYSTNNEQNRELLKEGKEYLEQEVDTSLNSSDFNVTLFPNPNVGIFELNSTKQINSVLIYNAVGKLVFQKQGLKGIKQKIDVRDLAKGLYTIKVLSKEKIITMKFIKE